MRWIRNFVGSLILMGMIGACLKQPDLSIIPQISIQNVSFVRGSSSQSNPTPDTITMTLNFADGNGDLGVSPDETAIYRSSTDSTDIQTPYYYVYDSTQPSSWLYLHKNNFTSADLGKYKYVNFASFRKYKTLAPFDTLPALSCKKWEIRLATQVAPIVSRDTLFIQNNPNYNNIFVNIYYTPNLSVPFTYFDPNTYFNGTFSSNCVGNFVNGRFPILSSNLGSNSPIQGTLTYKFQSFGLYPAFRNNTIKLSIYITDRAFNKSNVVTSSNILIN